jgi:4-diphosphocytidyl-2-C-methyl-D-erythritol kinase
MDLVRVMSEWSTWPAPAKLNLFLRIVGRREDGYHLLQTVFQLLDWGDTVRLRVLEDGRIERSAGLEGVPPEQDLAVRAARLLKQHTGARQGADIVVEKCIPAGGGLGGGSSDAASVLVALNHLWGTGLSLTELAAMGLELGADVPVFVHGRSAWAEGVGERLQPLELPPASYVILDPGVQVSTEAFFRATELTRNAAPARISSFLGGGVTDNAFAPLARSRHPEIAEAMDWLGQFGPARLSGSGACVFVQVPSRQAGEGIAARCPQPFRAFVAEGVNISPLLAKADISGVGA